MGGRVKTTVYINYFDGIDDKKARALMAVCADIISKHNPAQLYFFFSSTGGSVDAGIALYNYLRALPVGLVMHNTGSIDSVANVVFLAADERYASPVASFLLHGITWGFGAGARLSWTELQETSSRFRADEARISDIIIARTSIAKEELAVLFRQGDSVGLPFATAKGLVQEIREAKVQPGALLVSCNFA
jgi:ATP-dependent Clp protease protease subunit